MAWLYLALAIGTELAGTLGLRALADQRTWWAIALVAVGYTISFITLALALRQLNVAVVYALWSAFGMAAVAVAGVLLFNEHLNLRALVGMAIMLSGVLLLVSSGSVRHG